MQSKGDSGVEAIVGKESVFIAVLWALSGLPAWSGEFDAASTDGMAGAGVARPWGGGVQNSAAMSILPGFAGHTDIGFQEGGWSAGGVVMETPIEARMGAWSGLRRTSMDDSVQGDASPGWLMDGETLSNPYVSYVAGLGLGFSVVPERLGLGLSGSYERVESDLGGLEKDVDLTGSIAGRIGEYLTLAGALRSFLPNGEEETWGEVGAWWDDQENIGIGLDGTWRESWFGVRAGAEVRLGGELALRGGYSIERNEHLLGLGIGTMNESGRIDYGLQWVPVGENAGSLFHTIGFTFNLYQLR